MWNTSFNKMKQLEIAEFEEINKAKDANITTIWIM